MNTAAIPIYIIKGTDNAAQFAQFGYGGNYDGNTDIDRNITDPRLSLRGLFIHPGSFRHAKTLLEAAEGSVLLNCISDPDTNPGCLRALAKAMQGLPCAVINHPAKVLQTRRPQMAQLARDIPGLQVPDCRQLDNGRPQELKAQLARSGLRYPLLVREAGSHNGVNLLKIDGPEELKQASQWHSRTLYATEYCDCRSGDGLYRKCRLFVFSSGRVIPRHLLCSPQWNVGISARKNHMAGQPKLLDEEAAFLRNFEALLGPARMQALRELGRRSGLDYLGVDCNLLPNGELLLFEANITMNVRTVAQFPYTHPPVRAIAEEVVGMMLSRLA